MKSETFKHGGDITAFAQELSCDLNEIIDLSSNINFIKPNITTDFNQLDISSYPTYNRLYEKIASKYKVKSNNIELFNGGSSAIFTLFKHLKLKHCTIYSPAYLEYKKASIVHNYKLTLINRFNNINHKVKKGSFIIFVNPSTPDGTYYDIHALMKKWIKKECTILIDESFLDFTKSESAIGYLKSYDKLYILKSMTKFYSSAGIRVGTLISTERNIKKLQKNEPMWKLSAFDMHYLLEVLEQKTFIKKTLLKNKTNRELLISKLLQHNCIKKIYPSQANYLLIQLQGVTASQFQELLKPHKIMVRDCTNFDFLDNSYVRIAVKSKQSIKALNIALKSLKI